MPNIKIYVDASQGAEKILTVQEALPALRSLLCRELAVDVSACQFAVLPVSGLGDQPQVNAEMLILPRPERTRERILDICTMVRTELREATGLSVAVRSSMLDAETYVGLK